VDEPRFPRGRAGTSYAAAARCPSVGFMGFGLGAGRMAMSAARKQASRAGDAAVSDVLGSVLLVGMTVGMAVVLSFLLLTYKGPQPAPHSSLAVTVVPGAGGWGSGDEQVRIRDLGGDPLRGPVHVVIHVGSATTDLTGAALGGAFADGKLTIGESWSRTMAIGATDLVRVDVVAGSGSGTALLASLTEVPGAAA